MSLEPLAAQVIDGTHAYAEKAIQRGNTLNIRLSSTNAYQITIVRLGTDPDSPAQDTVLFNFGGVSFNSQTQPIFLGSYVNIEPPLEPTGVFPSFTLECWIRLRPSSAPRPERGIISQHSFPDKCGLGLFLDPNNQLVFYAGSGATFDVTRLFQSTQLLTEGSWHHVAATYDSTAGSINLYLDGTGQAFSTTPGIAVTPGPAPLRIGAFGENHTTGHLVDGDFAMPIIYNRALSFTEITDRFNDKGLTPPAPSDILACWPLNEEQGTSLHDISPFNRVGTIINNGSWMIGGPSFDPSVVNDGYNPSTDPNRGHGLRLCSDDLYDCSWSVTQQYPIPPDTAPGVYVARLNVNVPGGMLYDVPFVVTKNANDPKASIVVLCNTNTWLAYNSAPFAANDNGLGVVYGTDGPIADADKRTGFSCYRNHQFQEPTFQIGINLPWPNARPYVYYGADQDGYPYSHLLRAERFLHVWLVENGYAFDVITGFDLFNNPGVLSGYKVLMIAGHSEYWSTQELDAVAQFLNGGGRVIVYSGNTAFWRISFDANFTLMECRKSSGLLPGTIADWVPPGESFHSQDGRRGGVIRRNGYQVSNVLGLESAGDTNVNPLRSFQILQPNHFVFSKPNSINLTDVTSFGTKSVGHEWDAFYSDEDPTSVNILGQSPAAGVDFIWNYDVSGNEVLPSIANIMYWERPAGGLVFYIGSIAASMGLRFPDQSAGGQLRMSLLLANVLSNFLS
jgi:Concanavalin A-like lectin/glucanases superfamily